MRLGIYITISSLSSCIGLIAIAETAQLNAIDPIEKIRFAPMSIEDKNDPQQGYAHIPMIIRSTKFYFGKAKDLKTNIVEIETQEINLYSTTSELLNGFKPSTAFCRFKESQVNDDLKAMNANKSWQCEVYESNQDLKMSIKNRRKDFWAVDIIKCNNCEPIPSPGLTRICSGLYVSYLDPNDSWTDTSIPEYPDVFNKKGGCKFDSPWFEVTN